MINLLMIMFNLTNNSYFPTHVLYLHLWTKTGMLQSMEWFNVTMELHGSLMDLICIWGWWDGESRDHRHPSITAAVDTWLTILLLITNVMVVELCLEQCFDHWDWSSPMARVVTSFTSSFCSSRCVWRVYGTNSGYLILPSLTHIQHTPGHLLLGYTPCCSPETIMFDPFRPEKAS